jgi:hypothetical protein
MTTATANAPTHLTKDSATKGMLAIQATAEQVQQELLSAEGFGKTLAIATGLVAIQEAMTDETVAVLKALEGTDVGFKTDKDHLGSGYGSQTIKACAVRALLNGAYLHGNEFNIIAGGCYLTQQYYLRKLREYPNVTDVQIDVDIPCVDSSRPAVKENYTMLVGGYACCRVNGRKVEIYARESTKFGDQRMAVSAYKADIDQAQGKARKRLAQRLFERIAGVDISDDSEMEDSVLVVEPEAESVEHQTIEPAAEVDWAAELTRHGGKDSPVFQIGVLLRDAPSAQDRAGVLKAARQQLADGAFDQRGYDTLQKYARHKDAEEAAAAS